MHTKRSVSIRELRKHATEIVRQVRVDGIAVEITNRGKVIARLIPIPEGKTPSKEMSTVWTDLDLLAAEIGARWPAAGTAVDTVREGRRDL